MKFFFFLKQKHNEDLSFYKCGHLSISIRFVILLEKSKSNITYVRTPSKQYLTLHIFSIHKSGNFE